MQDGSFSPATIAAALGEDTMGYRRFQTDLSGRIALVTGANSGMGKETARELARMGAEVVLGCRSTQLGEAAAHEIVQTTGSTRVTVMQVDLSSPASVHTFARLVHQQFPKLAVGHQRARPPSPDHAAAAGTRG
jgi:retinol dehydrogenase 14